MPTIKGVPGPVRLFFYSFDCNEPMHVHAEREQMSCKYWIRPVLLASNDGFGVRELGRIRALIHENAGRIRKAWNEHCR
jgi:hypothetical protein